MNYSIAFYSFFSKRGEPDTHLDNVTEFIKKNGMSRFIYNMNHKWVWNVNGYDNYKADGDCCFIEYE